MPHPQTSPMGRILALILSCIWVLLMTFAVVAIINPPWLEKLARRGAMVEAQNYIDFGNAALRNGDTQTAIENYRKALQAQPDDPGIWVNLAIANSRIGERVRARRILAQAAKEIPEDLRSIVYYNLGEMFQQEEALKEAIQCYRLALESSFDPELPWRKIAVIQLNQEQYSEALTAFGRILDEQTSLVSPYRNMLRRSLSTYKSDTALIGKLREELAENVDIDDLSPYDTVVMRNDQRRNPEIAKTHNYLGLIHARLENTDSARYHFEQSNRIWPGNVDAVTNLQRLETLDSAAASDAAQTSGQ